LSTPTTSSPLDPCALRRNSSVSCVTRPSRPRCRSRPWTVRRSRGRACATNARDGKSRGKDPHTQPPASDRRASPQEQNPNIYHIGNTNNKHQDMNENERKRRGIAASRLQGDQRREGVWDPVPPLPELQQSPNPGGGESQSGIPVPAPSGQGNPFASRREESNDSIREEKEKIPQRIKR
jgi:hypothetical protein